MSCKSICLLETTLFEVAEMFVFVRYEQQPEVFVFAIADCVSAYQVQCYAVLTTVEDRFVSILHEAWVLERLCVCCI